MFFLFFCDADPLDLHVLTHSFPTRRSSVLVTMRLVASMRPSMSERNPIPLILTAIGSVLGTVAVLSYYGYVHIAKPEDALLLADYTLLQTVPGEDSRVSLKPASQVAQCIDGVLVLVGTEQTGLTGVLGDGQKRAEG